MCVAVFSNIRQLPACQVFRITHTDYTVNGVHMISVGFLLEPTGAYLYTTIANTLYDSTIFYITLLFRI